MLDDEAALCSSRSGFINGELLQAWFTIVFVPHVKAIDAKLGRRTHVLICGSVWISFRW